LVPVADAVKLPDRLPDEPGLQVMDAEQLAPGAS
jgi:hypothetical protein